MKKILLIFAVATILLGFSACSDNEKQVHNLLSFTVNNASLKPIGADSLSYKASCHVSMLVNRDGKLQLTIANLQVQADTKLLPITLQLESEALNLVQKDATHLELKGDMIKSSLFVISNLIGDIDLAKHLCIIQFVLNGQQSMQLQFATDPASLLKLLELLKTNPGAIIPRH